MVAARIESLPEWTQLQLRVKAVIEARGLTKRAVSTASSVPYPTLQQWLTTPGHLINRINIDRIAAWLDITPTDATTLQGGTAEDKCREGQRAYAARQLKPPRGTFHTDVPQLIAARGWSPERAAHEAMLPRGAIRKHLRRGGYPSPEECDRLGSALNATPEQTAAWRMEAEAWALRPAVRAGRSRQTNDSQQANRTFTTKPCLHCKKPFTTTSGEQEYCTSYCADAGRARWRRDTGLKKRFLDQADMHRMTVAEIEREADLPPRILGQWLTRPKGRLSGEALPEQDEAQDTGRATTSPLGKVAAWLGISIAEAIALQGGTVMDRRLALLDDLNKNEPQKLADYRKKLREDPEFRQKTVERAAAAVRGTSFTKERRERISIGVKRYLKKYPEARKTAANTLETRIRMSLSQHLRHTPKPTLKQRRQWAQECAPRVGLSSTAVEYIQRTILQERGIIRGSGGRPTLEDRHREAELAIAAEYAATGGKRASNDWWDEQADRANKREGRSDLTGPGLRIQFYGHIRTCPEVYAPEWRVRRGERKTVKKLDSRPAAKRG